MVSIASRRPIYKKHPEEFLIKRKVRFFSLKILRAFQIILSAIILGFIIWSVWFDKDKIVRDFIETNSKELFLKSGFAIQKIEIHGNERVSNNEILEAMLKNELEDISNYPILMLSLKQIKENLADITWIEDISITKNLPGTVIINIKEREPVALWQNNKELWVSDKDGNLISKDIKEYVNLPLIVGKNEKEDIKEVFDIMSSSDVLYSKVASFSKVGERRWDVKLNNGILVKLPEKYPVKAWRKLEDFQKEKSILSKNISYIDMRIEGQLVMGF